MAVVLRDDSAVVGDGKFVEGVDELGEGHGEADDFGVVEGVKDFLELGHGGEDDEGDIVGVVDDWK